MESENTSVILAAIETLQASNAESHEAITMAMKGGIKGLHLRIETENKLTASEIRELAKTLREHNGRLRDCEEENLRLKAKTEIYDKQTALFAWAKKRWILVAISCIAVFSVLSFLYDIGAITKAIKFLIDKI